MKPSPQKYVRLRVLKRHGATPMLLLLLACGVLYPVTAAWSSAAAGASDAHALAAARPSHFAAAPGVPAAAIDLNSTPIYGQPYDGRAFEGPSSKISGGQQFDREVVDDFDLNASLTRVVVRGARGGYNMPPNPTYYGVYVRFYDGVQGTPGALQAEHFLPPGAPGVVFDAARPSTFDITLPSPFNATGRHFFSVQPVFGGSETWGVMSGGYPNVRGSAWLKRDRVADGGTWTVGGVAGNLNDMSFDLFGTLLSAPRIDTLSPNPIPRSGLLRISGAYFGAAQGASRLTIDGKQSQYIAHWSDSLIIAYVPEASTLGDVPVSITTDAGTGSATLGVTTRPADGRIRWRFTVAGDYVLHRSGIGADRSIYLNDVNGRLYALSPDGGLKWVFQAGKVGYVGPVTVGADGTVYVAGLVP
ncbi:MAG TPA: IPT/TIG domain-containing protein, partial [Pyrinomonadaceae bacterium]|nr:IPT/TIG domain-containing protein [Pyrinomonadaceae bacterium]